MKKIILALFSSIFIFLTSVTIVSAVSTASNPEFDGEIVKVYPQEFSKVLNQEQVHQKIEVNIFIDDKNIKKVSIDSVDVQTSRNQQYKVGDKVIVSSINRPDGTKEYIVVDYIRREPLYGLFIIFIILVLLIARRRGLFSLVGMVISFFVIFKFLLPQIISGYDPVLISIVTSAILIPVTFYLSHGINLKTTIAVFGTFISLVVSGILAMLFLDYAKISGFSSEEATFLIVQNPQLSNIKGLVLGGIIVGLVGILDDITISQSSIVQELKVASPKLGFFELFQKSMVVGKDHISSLVNTLILVYTGAALPLLLLFINNPKPFADLINFEIIAEEIIRTLVSSIGLILAVPITSFIASLVFENKIIDRKLSKQ